MRRAKKKWACEIAAFSSPTVFVGLGFSSILPDLVALHYPYWLIRKALLRMHRRTPPPECSRAVDDHDFC